MEVCMVNISDLSEIYFQDFSSEEENEKITGGSLIFCNPDGTAFGRTVTILPGGKILDPFQGYKPGDKFPGCPGHGEAF
jgi:hypothetical protein